LPIKARRKVAILDCCWSGLALNGQMADGRDVAAKLNVNGTFILTATAETRQALAPPGEAHTAFTGELLDLIEQGVHEAPEFLSMNMVYQKLVTHLGAKHLPIPQQRNRNDAGNICLFRNRSLLDSTPVSTLESEELHVRNISSEVSRRLPGLIRELKRVLHDPTQRIAVSELFMNEVNSTVARVKDRGEFPINGRDLDYVSLLEKYESAVETLLPLLAIAVFYDDEQIFCDLWVRTLQRMSTVRNDVAPTHLTNLENLRHYPALLATFTIGVAAVLSGREGVIAQILTRPTWISPYSQRVQLKPFEYLNPGRILDGEMLKAVGAPARNLWKFPQSHHLRQVLRQSLTQVELDDDAYKYAFDRFELLASVISMGAASLQPAGERAHINVSRYPWMGEFISLGQSNSSGGDVLGFAAEVQDSWPTGISTAFDGDQAKASEAVTKLGQRISRFPEI
jgi:hypothetical protein